MGNVAALIAALLAASCMLSEKRLEEERQSKPLEVDYLHHDCKPQTEHYTHLKGWEYTEHCKKVVKRREDFYKKWGHYPE